MITKSRLDISGHSLLFAVNFQMGPQRPMNAVPTSPNMQDLLDMHLPISRQLPASSQISFRMSVHIVNLEPNPLHLTLFLFRCLHWVCIFSFIYLKIFPRSDLERLCCMFPTGILKSVAVMLDAHVLFESLLLCTRFPRII